MVRSSRSSLVWILALAAPVAAWAFCGEKCKWEQREGRFEGVIDQRQVADEDCELLAVQCRRPRGAAAPGKLLNLFFWLPSSQEVSIEVWEPRTNYWMVPSDRHFAKGRQVFSWPRGEVVDPLGLKPEELYAKVKDVAGRVYFPVLLSAGGKPEIEGGYDFFFRSGAGLDVACTISRQEGGKLVRAATFRHAEDDPGVFHLTWDGLDAQKNPAPAGLYVLNLKGDLLSEKITPLNLDFSFWHGGKLE